MMMLAFLSDQAFRAPDCFAICVAIGSVGWFFIGDDEVAVFGMAIEVVDEEADAARCVARLRDELRHVALELGHRTLGVL